MSVTDDVQGMILAETCRFLTQMNLEVRSCALPRELWRALIRQCFILTRGKLDRDILALCLVSQVGLIDVFSHDRPEIMWGFSAHN